MELPAWLSWTIALIIGNLPLAAMVFAFWWNFAAAFWPAFQGSFLEAHRRATRRRQGRWKPSND